MLNMTRLIQSNLVNPYFSRYQNKDSGLTHSKTLNLHVFGIHLMREKISGTGLSWMWINKVSLYLKLKGNCPLFVKIKLSLL